MRITAGKHRDRSPAGDETHRRHSHVTEFGLQGMGDGGRELTLREGRLRLKGCGGMGG